MIMNRIVEEENVPRASERPVPNMGFAWYSDGLEMPQLRIPFMEVIWRGPSRYQRRQTPGNCIRGPDIVLNLPFAHTHKPLFFFIKKKELVYAVCFA